MKVNPLEHKDQTSVLLNVDMNDPPHEVGQALANPSPWGEGSQNFCSLSFWERARVRAKSVLPRQIQQRPTVKISC